MEEFVIIKNSELKAMFDAVLAEIRTLRNEFKDYKTNDDTQAFTIKETAIKLSLNYWTIRRLVKYRELQPVYITGNSGHYRITATSIKIYLEKKSKKIM